MKAKEYAQRYHATASTSVITVLAITVQDMLKETRDLAKDRHVSTVDGLFGVYDEINQKWIAFCNLIHNNVVKHSFIRCIVASQYPHAQEWVELRYGADALKQLLDRIRGIDNDNIEPDRSQLDEKSQSDVADSTEHSPSVGSPQQTG